MGITTRNFGPDQSFDGIDLNGAYSFQSEIYITKFSATGFDFTATRQGNVYTGSYIGSLDYLSFKTPPKTLEDLFLSNGNSPFSSYVIFKNGVLASTASSSSPLSLSSWIYSNADLKNFTNFYSGDDVFYSSTNNQLSDSTDLAYGYGGNDVYHANHNKLASDDVFYGGTGVDSAVLSGQSSHYTIGAGVVWDGINETSNNLTGFIITDNTKTYNTLQINQVERVQFSDGTVALDFSLGQSGYESAMMIGAAFGQGYVNAYFAAGLSLYDRGQTNLQVATLIENAGLIESQIGSTSNKAWVDFVYKNVMGVAPDKLTEAIFVTDLETGVYTKASLLALAADVSNLEQQIGLTGLQQAGLFCHPFL